MTAAENALGTLEAVKLDGYGCTGDYKECEIDSFESIWAITNRI